MPLSLTTVTNGTVIDAAAFQSYVDQIEYYLNEGIAFTDIQNTPWVDSVHVFKPEFYGSPHPRTALASGMAQYYAKDSSLFNSAAFAYELGRGDSVPVPGLQATLKIPKDNTSVRVLASFAAFEWGGSELADEGGVDDPFLPPGSGLLPAYRVATFRMTRDGSLLQHSGRRLYCSGESPLPGAEFSLLGGLVARKQICMADYLTFNKGIHTVGVSVNVEKPPALPPPPPSSYVDWKHVFVLQRNFVTDYHLR